MISPEDGQFSCPNFSSIVINFKIESTLDAKGFSWVFDDFDTLPFLSQETKDSSIKAITKYLMLIVVLMYYFFEFEKSHGNNLGSENAVSQLL